MFDLFCRYQGIDFRLKNSASKHQERVVSHKTKKVVVISGAGVSAESGLATFRDPDGLWQQYSLEDLATPEAFSRNPELVHRFYNSRRIQAAKAQPNAAHLAIAKLEQAYNVVVVTQNVDDLHERAGSTQVIHLHGKLNEARSSKNPNLVEYIGQRELQVCDFAADGTSLRPNIVWFGEDVPAMQPAINEVASADKILVVGTSLQVYPAASLLFYARPHAEKVLINLEVTNNDTGYQFIKGKAATEVPMLVDDWLAMNTAKFRESFLYGGDFMLQDIAERRVLERSVCLENSNHEDRYNKSYFHFVDYFSRKDSLNEQDLIIGANFTYGWMPTILNFKTDKFSAALSALNDAKKPERITDDQLLILKELINNSLVGVSKLLHFVNPEVYAIWDSRVCNFITGKRHKQKVENLKLYWSYLDLCKRVASHPEFDDVHRKFESKVGYKISPLRTVEQIMFISSNEPIV